ncbi:MAG: DUF2997 domain-containing protein [Cyanobacteriota bacterium]|jgi:hypothetical protein|nr:DUF2997 domain-containing protein [Cyanobacteriota bacterium]
MAQQSIRFRIRPDGRVEEVVEGVAGEACLTLTERIEAQLGTVSQRQSTSEAFQTQPQSFTVQQPLGHSTP